MTEREEVIDAIAAYAWSTQYGTMPWPPGEHWYQEVDELRESAAAFYDVVISRLLTQAERHGGVGALRGAAKALLDGATALDAQDDP